jgi:hypothetical protein
MKIIVVRWVPEPGMYGKAMRVTLSDHPRFTVGTRFDYGFFGIATDEGYVIISHPMPPSEIKKVKNSFTNKRVMPLGSKAGKRKTA